MTRSARAYASSSSSRARARTRGKSSQEMLKLGSRTPRSKEIAHDDGINSTHARLFHAYAQPGVARDDHRRQRAGVRRVPGARIDIRHQTFIRRLRDVTHLDDLHAHPFERGAHIRSRQRLPVRVRDDATRVGARLAHAFESRRPHRLRGENVSRKQKKKRKRKRIRERVNVVNVATS